MLKIKNAVITKNKEFSFLGSEWLLYGVDETSIEYKFIFIPFDYNSKVWDMHKSKIVILNRQRHKRKGYRLWTTDGKYTYVYKKDIRNWQGLVEVVYKHKMI